MCTCENYKYVFVLLTATNSSCNNVVLWDNWTKMKSCKHMYWPWTCNQYNKITKSIKRNMFTFTINASLILESCNHISNIADFKETQQNIKKNNIFLLCNLNVTETSCTRSLLSTYRTSDSSKSRQTVFFYHGKLLFF